MTDKQTVVLRTAFNDVFRVGDVTITQAGTPVPKAKVDEVRRAARESGVALYDVEESGPAAGPKTEGKGN